MKVQVNNIPIYKYKVQLGAEQWEVCIKAKSENSMSPPGEVIAALQASQFAHSTQQHAYSGNVVPPMATAYVSPAPAAEGLVADYMTEQELKEFLDLPPSETPPPRLMPQYEFHPVRTITPQLIRSPIASSSHASPVLYRPSPIRPALSSAATAHSQFNQYPKRPRFRLFKPTAPEINKEK